MTNDLNVSTRIFESLRLPAARADLEKCLRELNVQLNALTPDSFKMPQNAPAQLQSRLKKNELVLPDTEVLRQLLLDKARIVETLGNVSKPVGGIGLEKKAFVQGE